MTIAAGQEIEIGGQRYKVEDKLGGGSQGQVFRGRSPSGQSVALKFITDPRRRSREADILHGWSSDHVVGLLGHGEWNSGEVLVMDLVDGVTLQRFQEMLGHLKRGLHPGLALEIIAQVAQGLEEGYRTFRLKVHRDIKPSNIMLGRDGRAKILDFGIAYGLDLTVTGTPVATPLYMAPEQMEGARPPESLDHRTDQYALGLILAELLLGKPLRPMERDALARWLFVKGAEHEAAQERIGRQAAAALPPLMRMLSWEPEDRFPSMEHAVQALNKARGTANSPERLAHFGGRLMTLRDQSRLLDASDPAFLPLVDRKPTTSSTIYPDMTEELPSFSPPAPLSPAKERDAVRLDALTPAAGYGGLAPASMTPVDTAEAGSLPGLEVQAEVIDSDVVDTLSWKGRNSGRRVALISAALGIALLGGAYALRGGDDVEAPSIASAKLSPRVVGELVKVPVSEASEPEAPKVDPKADATDNGAPLGEAGAPEAVAALDVSPAQALPDLQGEGLKPDSEPQEVDKAIPLTDREEALPDGPNWRSQVPVDLEVAETFPAQVIPGKRPGTDLTPVANPPQSAKAVEAAPVEAPEPEGVPEEKTSPAPEMAIALGAPEGSVEDVNSPEVQAEPEAAAPLAVASKPEGVEASGVGPAQEEAETGGSPLDGTNRLLGLPEDYIPPGMTPRSYCLKLTRLGLLYRKTGDEDKALSYFAQARAVDPDYAPLDDIIDGKLTSIPEEPKAEEPAPSEEVAAAESSAPEASSDPEPTLDGASTEDSASAPAMEVEAPKAEAPSEPSAPEVVPAQAEFTSEGDVPEAGAPGASD